MPDLVHTAGPMRNGKQACIACSDVLTDETALDLPPGTTRYQRGARVLVLDLGDITVTGPYPEDARLPTGGRLCTSPVTTP